MTLQQMQKMLQDIVGEGKFIQFAFYVSPNEHTGLSRPWVKVETEIEVNQYKAYQSRTEDTLEANFLNCLEIMKKDLNEKN
jgi:hypothetical protein